MDKIRDIKNKINSCQTVSFDIFDTLVFRRVAKPEDVFLLSWINYVKKYNYIYPITAFEFKAKRILAEELARDHYWKEFKYTEVTMDEIFEFLDVPFVNNEHLKQEELNAEVILCEQNHTAKEIFDYAISLEKNIIIISDIYLSEEFIQTILKQCGYSNYNRLFVSSVYRKTKSEGSLYDKVITDLNLLPENILHIGDNFHSDIENARSKGIKTFHLPKIFDMYKNDQNLVNRYNSFGHELVGSIALNCIIKKIYGNVNSDYWYKFGYAVVGPIYYSFIDWLIKRCRENNIKHIYFLARDGLIMKKVFQAFNTDIEGTYLLASRRAFNLASINKLDENNLNFLISGSSKLPVKKFLSRIGLTPEDLSEYVFRVNLSLDTLVDSGEKYDALKQLFLSMEDIILARAEEERALLLEYFDEKMLFTQKNIALVDIGWHGSLQNSFEKIMKISGHDITVNGFYVATFPDSVKYCLNKISGFINNADYGANYELIKKCVEIFEFMFTSDHASFVKFLKLDNTLKPLFDETKQNDQQLRDLSLMQSAGLDFVNDMLLNKEHISKDDMSISLNMAISPISETLNNPQCDDLKFLGDLEHYEGFGNEYVVRKVAKRLSFFEKLSPVRTDVELSNAFWKIGFIKRNKLRHY